MTRQMMILDLEMKLKSLNSFTIYADVSLHDRHYPTSQKIRVASSDSDQECYHDLRFMVDDVHNERFFLKLKVVSPGGCFRKKVLGKRYMSVKKLFDYYQGNLPLLSAIEDDKEPPPYDLILNLGFSDPPKPTRPLKKKTVQEDYTAVYTASQNNDLGIEFNSISLAAGE